MHSLRQRYGGNLVHTHAGPNMVVINPISSPSMYSEKVSCSLCVWWKFFDENPNVSMIWIFLSCFSRWCRCSRAAGRRTLLLTSTAQPRLPTGTSSPLDRISPSFYWERVGVGRPPTASISSSTSLPSPAAPTRPSPVGGNWPKLQVRNNIVIQFVYTLWCVAEKWQAVYTVLEAFGNVSTCLNGNASRFSHVVSLDFDQTGLVTSASIQVRTWFFLFSLIIFGHVQCQKLITCSVATLQTMLLEKMRVTKRPEGETTFNVFYFLIAGVDSALRSGSLQSCHNHSKQ